MRDSGLATWVAHLLMRMFPLAPTPERTDLAEVFRTAEYRGGTQEIRRQLQLRSAEYRYQYESELCFLDKYFSEVRRNELQGRRILDLGSFTGGRLVYWTERYGFASGTGIDVDPTYAQAGRLFARSRAIDVTFVTGRGEALPFHSG